jgi:hypothetical protein
MSPKMEDWLLGTDITGWRAQMAYITPFGINVLVCTFMGFYLNRYSFLPAKPGATILKWLSAISCLFWFTIGVYMQGSQALGLGMGSFGLPVEKTLDGAGVYTTDNQKWFRVIALLTLNAGTLQAGMDFVNFKVCWCAPGAPRRTTHHMHCAMRHATRYAMRRAVRRMSGVAAYAVRRGARGARGLGVIVIVCAVVAAWSRSRATP